MDEERNASGRGWPGESRALEVFLEGGARRAWAPSSGPGAVEDLPVRSQTLVFVSSQMQQNPSREGCRLGVSEGAGGWSLRVRRVLLGQARELPVLHPHARL